MFNQVNLTGIVKSCQSVSHQDKPASALCIEIFGDSSAAYLISFTEINAQSGDFISITGRLTTRRFDVKDNSLVESDSRGYLRIIVHEHQVQPVSANADNTQQSESAQTSSQSSKSDKNISTMENLVIIKKDGNGIMFAGFQEPFAITKRTKNTVLLDVQQTVNAVVYTSENGKRYLNEILPASETQKTA